MYNSLYFKQLLHKEQLKLAQTVWARLKAVSQCIWNIICKTMFVFLGMEQNRL